MIYILIVMWYGNATQTAGKAAIAVEFNDKQSCVSAAAEIHRQQKNISNQGVGTILCAAKGDKK